MTDGEWQVWMPQVSLINTENISIRTAVVVTQFLKDITIDVTASYTDFIL